MSKLIQSNKQHNEPKLQEPAAGSQQECNYENDYYGDQKCVEKPASGGRPQA